tara:strand:+ start:8159 stop:10135 length:1977 start_codon:yes stop_codon:yes gene_type:complete
MSKYKTRMTDILLTMESKKALDKKADKSGMSKSILSKVYDRGMAAWKGGHRPGTTPQQWALARVNSFITKSSGTWGGADKDLAKQVRGEEKEFEIKVCEECGNDECVCETIEEALEVKYDKAKQGWFDKQGRRRYLGIAATNARMKKKLDLAIKTGDWTTFDIKKEEVQFNLEELVEAKMQVQNLKTLPHRTAFRATIKKVLPNVDAFGSDSNPDFLTFKGSKSDLERLATMAKQYKVGPIRENLEENTSKELPPHLKKLFGKDGKFINPKSQAVFDKMVKDAGGSDAFRKKHKMTTEMDETEVEECWSTHKQVGTKMKGGKSVPNCVPKSEARQLKDKDTEMMVVKHSKVIVIDKSDWDEYKLKGYKLAEAQDKDVVSNASGKNNSKSRIDDIEEKTVPKDKDTDQPKKYVSGLSDKDKKAHDKHLEKGSKKSDDDKSAYKQSPADKKAKTKPSVHTKKFKQMYGETKKLLEFTTAQIKTLEKEYAPLKGRTMSGEQLKKMNGILKKYDKSMLQKLANASIPMLTTGAKSELVINRGMKWTDFKEAMKNPFEPKDKGDKEKKPAGEDKDATIAKLEKENQMLKVKAEVDKMVEPNKDTGEVPLKVGLAQKILKDVKDGKRVKVKEKEGAKYKGVGTGQSKIEVDPKVDISPSAGGDK